jgi:hypothetical protein
MFCGIYVLMTHKSSFLYRLVIEWMIHYALQNDIRIAWAHNVADNASTLYLTIEEHLSTYVALMMPRVI